MYVLQLMDEYAAGFPILINGIFICIAIGWVYGVKQFSRDIKHMVGRSVSYWWQAMWCVMTPIIILVSGVCRTEVYVGCSVSYWWQAMWCVNTPIIILIRGVGRTEVSGIGRTEVHVSGLAGLGKLGLAGLG